MGNVARAVLGAATEVDKLTNVVFADGELEVVGEHLLEVASVDLVFVALVEEFEALSRLVLFARLFPAVTHDELDGVEVDGLLLEEVGVRALELVVDLLLAHFVEAEVVEDVSEVSHGNPVLVGLIIELESILQVGNNVAWQWVVVDLGGVDVGEGRLRAVGLLSG